MTPKQIDELVVAARQTNEFVAHPLLRVLWEIALQLARELGQKLREHFVAMDARPL